MYSDSRQPHARRLHPSPPRSAVPGCQILCYEGPDEPIFRSSLPAAQKELREPRPASSWKARPTHGSDRSCEAYGETSNQKILCQASDSTRGYLSVFLEISFGEVLRARQSAVFRESRPGITASLPGAYADRRL